jgi:hypothetical protein
MNSQDIQNLQESYLAVYDDETRETLEFGNWVNDLLDEGYDLSDYTWDELYETYIGEERAPGVKPYQPRKRNPLPAEKPLSGEMGDRSGYGDDDKMKDWKLNATPSTKDRKGRSISQRMNDEKPYKNRMMGELGRRSSRIGAEVDRVIRGKGEARATVSLAPKTRKEEFDVYDIILSHLIDEGYADTFEAAEAIMVNMSEDWRESIFEGVVGEIADKVASTAGSVVGTAQRAVKNVGQKMRNVAGTYEYARQKANGNLPSGGMNTTPRSREFTNISNPVNKKGGMKNPGPNFGRG